MLTNDLFASGAVGDSAANGPADEDAPHVERARTAASRLQGLGAYTASEFNANRDVYTSRDYASQDASVVTTTQPRNDGAPRVDVGAGTRDDISAERHDGPEWQRGVVDAAPTAEQATQRQAALRALRNLEATEARLERNAKRELDESRGKLVQDLLPVLDNLDRTIRASQAHSDPAMLEGVRMVRQQLEGVLRSYGVVRVDAIGTRFDPNMHEAIGVTAVGEPARHGVVIQQAEPGYVLDGRLLRAAKVSVGKLVPQSQPVYRPQWR